MNLVGKRFENSRLGMDIYVYEIDGKEWFVGKDIAILLGYKDPSATVRDNVNKTYKKTMYIKTIENIGNGGITHSEIRTINNNLSMINEFGLYQLVAKSTLPKAIEFQKWIYEEVLPSLRKNNFYVDGENINENQITELKEEIGKLSQQVNNFSNILVNNKKKRQRLDTYLRQMFPNVENVYEQFLTKMKSSGMLDKNNRPTELFMKYNADNNMFCHIVKTTDVVEDYLTLTNVGMENICKRAYIKDGKIHLKKL